MSKLFKLDNALGSNVVLNSFFSVPLIGRTGLIVFLMLIFLGSTLKLDEVLAWNYAPGRICVDAL